MSNEQRAMIKMTDLESRLEYLTENVLTHISAAIIEIHQQKASDMKVRREVAQSIRDQIELIQFFSEQLNTYMRVFEK